MVWSSLSLPRAPRPNAPAPKPRVPAGGRRPPTCSAASPAETPAPPRWGAGSRFTSPAAALAEGSWVKLICGASFEDAPTVRNLALAYTLAGADCVDCAADGAVVEATRAGMDAAVALGAPRRPWLMVSVNDDEDPHFRKALFDPRMCPADCPRPCESACPAAAIPPLALAGGGAAAAAAAAPWLGEGLGVHADRCYGCGRCVPICPLGIITTESYTRPLADIAALLQDPRVDAIEIHTGRGDLGVGAFQRLWADLTPHVQRLRLVAVSCPDLKEGMVPAMQDMHDVMCSSGWEGAELLWQLDGRPMSGDIGVGATRACVALAGRVLADSARPAGHLQLAGGTNAHTLDALAEGGNLKVVQGGAGAAGQGVAGAAFGGYARKILMPVLARAEAGGAGRLEDDPALLEEAVELARGLVQPWKERARG